MDSSHIATGTITALLATVLVYLSHWPLQPLDLPTASAFAGLLVAASGGGRQALQIEDRACRRTARLCSVDHVSQPWAGAGARGVISIASNSVIFITS
jgi:hypothetical protein